MAEKTFSSNSVLPPIPTKLNEDGDDESSELLLSSKNKLRATIQHLTDQVLESESKVWSLMDELWRKAAEQVEKEKIMFKKQLDEMSSKLDTAKHELCQSKKAEQLLVEQQNQMSIELIAEKRDREKATLEMKSMKDKLSSLQLRLRETDNNIQGMKLEMSNAKLAYQNELDQKNQSIKENQEKAKKLSDKVQGLQEQLKTEKQFSQKMQQTLDGDSAKNQSDNKKLCLEITKLKNQLRTSNSSLGESQREIEKLQSQLKRQNESTESDIGLLNKQHAKVVKGLQNKIESLEKEIATLNMQYQIQIESLKDQLEQANQGSKEPYLEARIKFLTHQNRKEKDKLNKEVKSLAS